MKDENPTQNLKDFALKNFSRKFFSLEEKEILNKNYNDFLREKKSGRMDVDEIDSIIQEGRSRSSISVNLKAGYNFKFLKKLDTEVKNTDGIKLIKK